MVLIYLDGSLAARCSCLSLLYGRVKPANHVSHSDPRGGCRDHSRGAHTREAVLDFLQSTIYYVRLAQFCDVYCSCYWESLDLITKHDFEKELTFVLL